MALRTPKTAERLYFDLSEQIITTANHAIGFYLARPTLQNLQQLEDTLFDLMPFAKLTLGSCMGDQLKNKLGLMLENIQLFGAVSSVYEIDQIELLSNFNTEGNQA